MRNESEEYNFLTKLVDETRNMNKKKKQNKYINDNI